MVDALVSVCSFRLACEYVNPNSIRVRAGESRSRLGVAYEAFEWLSLTDSGRLSKMRCTANVAKLNLATYELEVHDKLVINKVYYVINNVQCTL